MRRAFPVIQILALFASCISAFAADPIAPNTDFLVRLKPPGINSKTAAKGDEIRAVVEQPASFAGYEMVGHVLSAKSSGKVKGQSVMQFRFQELQRGNERIPISATLKQVTNSKGAPDVDEEGRAIKKKSNVKKAVGGALAGALIGGLVGGAKGAAIGSGAGAAAALIAIELTAQNGADFELAPNSMLLVTVSPERQSTQ